MGPSYYPNLIVGGSDESSGRILETPTTQALWSGSPTETQLRFVGGQYQCGSSETEENACVVFDAAENSRLILDGTQVFSPNGSTWYFPNQEPASSPGSSVQLRSIYTNITSLLYGTHVILHDVHNVSQIPLSVDDNPSLVNLGTGRLEIRNGMGNPYFYEPRSIPDPFAGVQNCDPLASPEVKPSVQGWNYYEMNPLTCDTIIADFVDGYVGKEITVYVHSDRLFVRPHAEGGNGPIRLVGVDIDIHPDYGPVWHVPAQSFMRFRKVGAAYGKHWVNLN